MAGNNDNETDPSDFQSLMALDGVEKKKSSGRATQERSLKNTAGSEVHRRNAMGERLVGSGSLDGGEVQPVGPHDVLEYSADGVQRGVFKSLKQGKYYTDAKLDLHRLTVNEARSALAGFISDCVGRQIRCCLVLHGKGFHSKQEPVSLGEEKPVAKLKSYTAHWLSNREEVLAYCSALPKDGGVGAVYVLFRKSEAEKDKNRQRFR